MGFCVSARGWGGRGVVSGPFSFGGLRGLAGEGGDLVGEGGGIQVVVGLGFWVVGMLQEC